MFQNFTDLEIRYYMFKLLEALDSAHERGIMHRDVKPGNILFNQADHELRLIDWGLAEFYLPGKEYSIRVASLKYKGPELLIRYRFTDYSLDIWSSGVLFGMMIFDKSPFFAGDSTDSMLIEISKLLGSEELIAYNDKYGPRNETLVALLGDRPKLENPW